MCELLPIHNSIISKLKPFTETKKTPNILFHGPSGSGKKTILVNFINALYNGNQEQINKFVMYVNCAQSKGIKFIRESLKLFAKTHIHQSSDYAFKSIVLLNASNLTSDAQSSLRRCIEVFNHTTRFFMVVEDKHQILKPILSRFCEIYVPEPYIDSHQAYINLNLHRIQLDHNLDPNPKISMSKLYNYLTKLFKSNNKDALLTISQIYEHADNIYELGFAGVDILTLLKIPGFIKTIPEEQLYEYIITFNSVKKEIRDEKLLIAFILFFLLISSDTKLINISFM
jgi:replication-associated recombination protein RarA